MNKLLTAIVGAMLALVLAGCAEPPQPTTTLSPEPSPTPPVETMTACLVTDDAEPTPGSPNAQALDGLARAEQELAGVATIPAVAADGEQAGVVQGLVDQGCQVVIGRGQALTDAMAAAARANPTVRFALMDATPTSVPTNLRPVQFDTHESAFLAGYLAASQSTLGTVGVFGGLAVPSATIYMDGFVQGVAYYSEQKGREIEVVGWNLDTQQGTFVQSPNSPWNDPQAGRTAAVSLTDAGADVVLAVAGQSGVGALEWAQASSLRVIWSDSNGCQTQAQYCDQMLGSVVKNRGNAVFELISAEQQGRGAAGVFTAELRNGGTELIPAGAEFAPELAAELGSVEKGIIDGTIKVVSPAAIG